ncbi:MAG: hypothetical protein OEM38_01720 [Gammaproteobacteria bacterium]|nr:hypothetical protein [Gammaproteobacteria bacterium]
MKSSNYRVFWKLMVSRSTNISNVFFSSIIYILILSGVASANSDKTVPHFKVGTNMLSLLLIGDINGSLEYPLSNQVSLVSTAHYVKSSALVSADGEGYRVSAGVRTYGSFQNEEHAFMELKAGLSHYENPENNIVTDGSTPLSIEFYGGVSNDFNDILFYEIKLGLIRFLQTGNISLGGGFNVGFKF